MSNTAIIQAPSSDLSLNEAIIKEGADKLIAASKELVVDSQTAMEDAATMAKSLSSAAKKVEEIRKNKVDPLNAEVKAINLRLKTGISDVLLKAADDVKGKMLNYTKEQQRKAEEERIAREKELQEERFAAMILAEDSGEDTIDDIIQSAPPVQAVAVPQITRSFSGAIAGVRKTWTFEVVDIAALADARPDLVEAITSKINAEIKGDDGKRDIPGLRIYQQESMGVR